MRGTSPATRAGVPALRTCCEECGREFADTAEMVEARPGVYVHARECEGFSLGPTVVAPLVAVLAVTGGCGGFLAGLWLLGKFGWLWPFALAVAVLGCWLAVAAIRRTEV